jgi:AraC-like DNA-binding protein
MRYITIQPPESLTGVVRYFWILEGEASGKKKYIHRSMADGCAELIFHYKGAFDELVADGLCEKSFSSGLAGQSQKFRRFQIEQDFGIFGVYLYPFAVSQLFAFSALEIRNEMIDLRCALGMGASELEEKVMLSPNNDMRVKVVSEYLEKRLLRSKIQPGAIVETIRKIIHAKENGSVDELAKRTDLSIRQFERKFKEATGFGPKLFSRIIRFQRVLSQYGANEISLTRIAYECEYYDQSHFIHDFKEFSGHNPKEYFSGVTEATEWRDR